MVLILFGIGFGAWKVLIDIQKLKIVPADSLPIIMSEMNLRSSEIIGEKKDKKLSIEKIMNLHPLVMKCLKT